MLSFALKSLCLLAPLLSLNAATEHTEQPTHLKINASQLKNWYAQEIPMAVVDARSAKYFDGVLLPKAIWLAAESTEQEIATALPNKNQLVVVYCWSTSCPASGWLYDKLRSLGYTQLYEYPEGLHDWQQKGFPTQKRNL